MIDIPLGKALVPVETEPHTYDCPKQCKLYRSICDGSMACVSLQRKDGKNVIYKLVDYPEEAEK